MGKIYVLVLFTLLTSLAYGQNRFWVSAAASNWNNTANWSATSGGAGGASVPVAGNVAVFNASGAGNCLLDIAPTVGGITMNGYTGTINLQGNTLTTTGVNTFTSGTISNTGAAATLTLNTTGLSTFNGVLFNVPITGTSGRLVFSGSTFNGTVTVTKSDTNQDDGAGGNTFNAALTITKTGTGELRMGNTNPDIFNSTVTLNVNATGNFSIARGSAANQFNNNITIVYNSTGGVLHGANGGTSTLADTRTLTVSTPGAGGSGNLSLARLTQAGATAQNITLNGNATATLTLGPATTFNGPLTTSSPVLVLNTSTFNNTVNFTQTSSTTTGNSRGGNLFQNTATFTNTGDADLSLGTNAADAGDTFNGLTTFNDLGGGRIRIGEQNIGNVFNGAAVFNSSGAIDVVNRIQISRIAPATTTFNSSATIINNGNSSDIHISYDAGTLTTFNGPLILTSATSAAGDFEVGRDGNVAINGSLQINSTCPDIIQLSAGTGTVTFGNSTISIGPSGFSQGDFRFRNFTQTGTSAVNLIPTGTAIIRTGPATTFNGNVTITSPQLYLNGTTFNGTATLEKNGATNNQGTGNNVFASTTIIRNSGSGVLRTNGSNTFNATTTIANSGSADILLELNTGSAYNENVTFTNTGSSSIRIGYDGTNTFGGNIVLNSTSGTGITFCESATATATLAATRTITIGGSGFTTGDLLLERFTQVGATPQALTLTGTARLTLGPASRFDGNVTLISPQMLLNGTTFNGTAYLEKNGATDNNSTGNNIFNGLTQIVHSGSNNFLFANAGPDTFNAGVTFSNTGSGAIYLAHNVAGTTFNENIQLNSTGGSLGIYFSENATGSSTLAAGRTIAIGGSGFSAGDLRIRRFTQVGATPQSLTLLTATTRLLLGPGSQFDGNVTFISPQIFLQGTTFNGTAFIQKNGITDNNSIGNNIFNGTTQIVHSGSNNFLFANTGPDIFNADVTFSNTGSGTIYLAHNVAGNQFNGNIQVNSTGGSSGIYFSNNTTGNSTLAAGRTITVGGTGFTIGELRLQRFTQLGATPQSITLTSTALLRLGPTSTFNGNVTFIAPQVLLTGTTFNGVTYIEKNGINDNTSSGGNVFATTTTLVNSGSGSFEFASTSPEIFNGNLTVTNSGQSRIQIGIDAANNIFNGNVTINHGGNTAGAINTIIARNAGASAVFNGDLILNCTNLNSGSGLIIGNDGNVTINGNVTVSSTAGRGILFGSSTGLITLANGFTISAPAGTYTTGTLTLKGFTQVGPTPQALTLTGAADLTLGPVSAFNGDVTFITPQIYLNGTTFNGITYLEKTGAINNTGTGSNIFNGVTTIINSGSGNFISGNTSFDRFNNDLFLTNRGVGLISMADNSAGNIFGGDITVNSTSGGGIYFGNGANASASLATGKVIQLGASGFTTGELRLRRFTQLGATAQNLTFSGTAAIRLGPASAFDGDVTFLAPRMFADGSTFNGVTRLEKTGASDDAGSGGNVFNSLATLINTGTGYLMTGNASPDIFNGDLTVTNSNVSSIRLANNSTGNQFNGNIIVTNTAGTGILIGNTGGNSTFADGKTITIGGSGFTIGELCLRRFTQTGISAAQSFTLTGTAILRLGPLVTFNADVNFFSPQIYLEGTTFNGTTTFRKTGATINDNIGGNVFNGTTRIENIGSARWRLSTTAADTYNGPVTFSKFGGGALEPASFLTNQFASDITTNTNSAITFGTGGGVMEFVGTNPQSINRVGGTYVATLSRITLNKPSESVTLNTTINVVRIIFTSGIMNSAGANFPNFIDNATAIGANNLSYIDGPVRKTGNDAFDFPVGDNGFYRPISISAPTNAAHFFTAQYLNSPQAFGGPATWDPAFWTVSACEYWVLDRNTGASSNVSVTLSWDDTACGGPGYITNPADLVVTRWTGTNWVSHGNGGTTGTSSAGTIVSSGTVSTFSPFTIASLTRLNPLPVELKKFWAVDNGPTVTLNWITASESNNKSFTIQRSQNGIEFQDLNELEGAGTTATETSYSFVDESPFGGTSYYRLKQTDYDGNISFPGILSINRKGEGLSFTIHPNPAGNEIVKFNQKANIVIINSLDQVVGSARETDQIDVSSLAPGVYIIRNQNGQVARLVKK